MLVDPEISRRKLDRELEEWQAKSDKHRARGLLLLRRNDLEVDIGLACPFGLVPGQTPFGLIAVAVRLYFEDYDLKPPSLRFINAFSGKPQPPSMIEALEDKRDGSGEISILPLDPRTREHFFCAPGNRQFHEFPQHKGELWPVYRGRGAGRLETICDRLWRATAGTVRGWQLSQTVAQPPFAPMANISLLQMTEGRMRKLKEEAKAQHAAAEPAVPRGRRR